MAILDDISAAVEKGKAKLIKELVPKAIEEGLSAQQILNDGLLHGMNIVGDRFTRNEAFVPEVLVAARAMNKGTELIKPLLAAEGNAPLGKACLGTVQGDLHDIGKNIVKLMVESKNIEVIDLGVDVPPEKFIETAVNENCDLIMCSALLTTTMPMIRNVVEAAEKAGIRDKVSIMIGGAPITQEFCDQVGADYYTEDAATCANKAEEILKAKGNAE
ncbi:MAG: corrinoid protein [Oscillospiraceae bacterium]|nr:corrinoid protein [Oscillospiraceae bacterium]